MRNVLVVDDEEPVRRLVRDCLEMDGYEVREAADAAQAIVRVQDSLPDCLVLDVMMPGMSGLELLAILRAEERTAHLPVLMLTAGTDDATTWEGWVHGADYYLPKPFDIDHLMTWVDRLCSPVPDDDLSDTYDLAVGDLGDELGLLVAAENATAAALLPSTTAGPPAPATPRGVAGDPVGAPAGSTEAPGLMAELSAIYAPAVPAPQDWAADRDGPQVVELLRALDTGQIWVAYQPIVALGTGRVVGLEALARWAHPHRGDLGPQEFVPLAERHGLTGRLDSQVLDAAAEQVSAWNVLRSAAGSESLTLSINVSAERVREDDFLLDLREVLDRHGLSPTGLVLELNEVALMNLLGGSQQVVRDLLELGVSVAFDDFSAAVTSLSFLQRFHVDIVKVDRSLVRCLGGEGEAAQEGAATVAAIVSIAHRLGRAVVAEGVETEEQADYLRSLGCEYAQGYYFGFPASGAQLGRRLLTPGT